MSRARRRSKAFGKPVFSNALRSDKQMELRIQFIDRDKKRRAKIEGRIGDAIPFEWEWCFEDQQGTLLAFTASEARAQIKKLLQIPKKKRLPWEVVLQRVEYVT